MGRWCVFFRTKVLVLSILAQSFYFVVVLLAIFCFLPFVYALHAMHNTTQKRKKRENCLLQVSYPFSPQNKKIYIKKKQWSEKKEYLDTLSLAKN